MLKLLRLFSGYVFLNSEYNVFAWEQLHIAQLCHTSWCFIILSLNIQNFSFIDHFKVNLFLFKKKKSEFVTPPHSTLKNKTKTR